MVTLATGQRGRTGVGERLTVGACVRAAVLQHAMLEDVDKAVAAESRVNHNVDGVERGRRRGELVGGGGGNRKQVASVPISWDWYSIKVGRM